MAIQHIDIPSEGCHEPRHITNAGVDEAGKVITPSDSTPGSSVLRFLSVEDLRNAPLTAGLGVVTDGAGGLSFGTPGLGVIYGGHTITNNSTAIAVGAAVSPDFTAVADYVQVELFDFPNVQPSSGLSVEANTFILPTGGVYEVSFWASVESSGIANTIALNFGVMSSSTIPRSAISTIPDSGVAVVGGHSYVTVADGEAVGLFVASELAANITIRNAQFSVKLIEAL